MSISAGKILLILVLCFFSCSVSYGAFQRDPIKETQTDPIAVTQEFLTRESESGPASPSFKMNDTAIFFMKKPYDYIQNEELFEQDADQEAGFVSDEWDDWFDIEGNDDQSTEALDQQEVKSGKLPS